MTEETTTAPPADGLDAAIQEEAVENGVKPNTVTVLGKEFKLAEKLSVAATYGISRAQKDEDLAGLIDATAKLVAEADRESFMEHILGTEELDMEDFSNIFKDALEKVTGRPLEQ